MDEKKRMGWVGGSIVAALLIVLLATGIVCAILNRIPGKYALVYFPNGEIYVGQLSTFPRLKLSQPYILQVTKDANNPAGGNTFQLIPLKQTVWSTEDMYLSEDTYSFIAPLNEFSDVAQQMSGQKVQPTPQ